MKRSALLSYCCTLLLVSACGGSRSTPDDTSPPPAPVTGTVTGKVLDGMGNPVASAPVLLLGKQPVTTDSTGAFSVPDVGASYDIAVVSSDKQTATVYKGLTRRAVTLFLTADTDSLPTYSATVSGTVSGQGPYSSQNAPTVTFISPDVTSTGATADLSTGEYSADMSWSSPATTTGTLFALQAVRATPAAVPTSFTGYGRLDNVTLHQGDTLAAQDIHLEPISSASLNLKVTVPSDLTLFVNTVSANIQTSYTLGVLGEAQPSGTTFSYVVPQLPQTTYTVSVFALDYSTRDFSSTSVTVKSGLSAGSTTTIDLQDVPQLNQPSDDEGDVTSTTDFSWSPFSGGIHSIEFTQQSSDSTPPLTIQVVTAEAHTSLPDLSVLGVNVPASTSFSWQVVGYSPLASVDALLDLEASTHGAFPKTDTNIASSATRTFTTASKP